MGYTVSWTQLPFHENIYKIITRYLPTIVNVKVRLEGWGFVVGENDCECLCIERYPTQMTYVKINRDPYTRDVMKTLILMVEYGVAEDLAHDDTDMSWFLEALEEVHAIHYLVSYESQKAYFNRSTANTKSMT